MKNQKFLKFFNNYKAWLYLLPAIILLAVFLIYPLIDVFIYSFEEDYNFVYETSSGIGLGNYKYVLTDIFFKDALKNTFVIVIITVPLSTMIALAIAVVLNAIRPLQKLFQTIFFLPYVTNTIAIGLVFMLIFDYSVYSKGFANTFLGFFGINPIDFIDGPHWAKMFVISFYITWSVMPFKIIVLVGALQGVKKDYYDAAKVDQATKFTIFRRITVPMISPYIAYLIITGFIGRQDDHFVAVAQVAVHKVVEQRPFQPRAETAVHPEAGARQLRAALVVDQAEIGAEVDVVLRLEVELVRFAVVAQRLVVLLAAGL